MPLDPDDLAAAVAWFNEQRLTQPHELHRRLSTLEEHMATSDAQIATITANLENIRGDVQRLSDLATSLQTEIAQQDPVLAAKLQPLVDLSAQIAAKTPEPAPPTP